LLKFRQEDDVVLSRRPHHRRSAMASGNECYDYYREDEGDVRQATPPPARHGQDEDKEGLKQATGAKVQTRG
jgi:hypothetical protein